MTRPPASAFTLIELLVVITIIVVLLALLTPALDRAIYEAELAICGTRLRGTGSGVLVYAFDHRRHFPHRPAVLQNDGVEPDRVYDRAIDDRPTLTGYVALNLLLDPLIDEVDVTVEGTDDDTAVYVSYDLWFGFQYRTELGPESGMFRLGDRFSYDGARFDLLAGDEDAYSPADANAKCTHQDANGVLSVLKMENQSNQALGFGKQTVARWTASGTAKRGALDTNHVAADGSVRRFDDVPWDAGEEGRDPRMARVPQWNSGTEFAGVVDRWNRIPFSGR